MRLALWQTDIVWEDKQANLDAFEAALANVSKEGVDLFVCPEMSFTGFTMRPAVVAEPLDGPTMAHVRKLAEDNGTAIIFGFVQSTASGYTNTLVLLDSKGELQHSYEKVHPFSFGGETKHYRAGQRVATCQLGDARLATFVCYDLRFPELFTSLARQVQLFVVIANWPAARVAHWTHLLKARALDTLSFVAGVNRTGEGGGLRYSGGTAAFDPWGEAISPAQTFDDGVGLFDLDLPTVAKVRAEFSLLDDRRPDLYRSLDH